MENGSSACDMMAAEQVVLKITVQENGVYENGHKLKRTTCKQVANGFHPYRKLTNGKKLSEEKNISPAKKACERHNTEQLIAAAVTISIPPTLFSVQEAAKKKLVLYFDVRNTVIVADSVTNIGVEEALNAYLTGVAWGSLVSENPLTWSWHKLEPALKPPRADSMTVYKYLERRFVKSVTDRLNLRMATGNFTETEFGKEFAPYFEHHLKLLEWSSGDVNPQLTMQGKNGKYYHYIVPAFFRLLQYLVETERDFAIVFRTYGCDCPNVLAATKEMLAGKHPHFPTPLPVPVDLQPGRILRNTNAAFDCDYKQTSKVSNHSAHASTATTTAQPQASSSTAPENQNVVLSSERQIFDMFNALQGVCGYVDDFHHWQTHDYNHGAAKPLWIDPTNDNVHHIFFDDNIRVLDDDSIVDVRLFDASDVTSGCARSLTAEEAALFEDVCLVQSDLLECISKPEYFVDKLRRCESRYEGLSKKLRSGKICNESHG